MNPETPSPPPILPPGDRKSRSGILRCAWIGGVILGGIGFAGGFFGPMIFTPQSNQGPLLGILITGPGGFVLGCIVGAIVGGMGK